MTKAFLEDTILKPENEKLILEAFSEKNLNKVKIFNTKRRPRLKKSTIQKLTINNLLVLKENHK